MIKGVQRPDFVHSKSRAGCCLFMLEASEASAQEKTTPTHPRKPASPVSATSMFLAINLASFPGNIFFFLVVAAMDMGFRESINHENPGFFFRSKHVFSKRKLVFSLRLKVYTYFSLPFLTTLQRRNRFLPLFHRFIWFSLNLRSHIFTLTKATHSLQHTMLIIDQPVDLQQCMRRSSHADLNYDQLDSSTTYFLTGR